MVIMMGYLPNCGKMLLVPPSVCLHYSVDQHLLVRLASATTFPVPWSSLVCSTESPQHCSWGRPTVEKAAHCHFRRGSIFTCVETSILCCCTHFGSAQSVAGIHFIQLCSLSHHTMHTSFTEHRNIHKQERITTLAQRYDNPYAKEKDGHWSRMIQI